MRILESYAKKEICDALSVGDAPFEDLTACVEETDDFYYVLAGGLHDLVALKLHFNGNVDFMYRDQEIDGHWSTTLQPDGSFTNTYCNFDDGWVGEPAPVTPEERRQAAEGIRDKVRLVFPMVVAYCSPT